MLLVGGATLYWRKGIAEQASMKPMDGFVQTPFEGRRPIKLKVSYKDALMMTTVFGVAFVLGGMVLAALWFFAGKG